MSNLPKEAREKIEVIDKLIGQIKSKANEFIDEGVSRYKNSGEDTPLRDHIGGEMMFNGEALTYFNEMSLLEEDLRVAVSELEELDLDDSAIEEKVEEAMEVLEKREEYEPNTEIENMLSANSSFIHGLKVENVEDSVACGQMKQARDSVLEYDLKVAELPHLDEKEKCLLQEMVTEEIVKRALNQNAEKREANQSKSQGQSGVAPKA